MENQEIKEANRKAMPMFILLVIAGAAAGGIMGFVIAKYGLHGFSENIERVADVFSTFVAPWMMFTIAVFVPLILSPYYMKTKISLLMVSQLLEALQTRQITLHLTKSRDFMTVQSQLGN